MVLVQETRAAWRGVFDWHLGFCFVEPDLRLQVLVEVGSVRLGLRPDVQVLHCSWSQIGSLEATILLGLATFLATWSLAAHTLGAIARWSDF